MYGFAMAWLSGATAVVAAEPGDDTPQAAHDVLSRAAGAHGLTRDRRLAIDFGFRGTPYRLRLDGTDVRYARTVRDRQGERVDTLVGSTFEVRRGATVVDVAPDRAGAWRRSLNSVAYFATLPRPLFDDAVIARSLGRSTLAGRDWDTVEVRFHEEGGGDDHDDVFRYWFDPQTGEMAYLAYTFRVNGGGVRLRRVIGRHEVEGVVLLDWANLGLDGPSHTIDAAVAAFERGELPQLSTIELADVRVRTLP